MPAAKAPRVAWLARLGVVVVERHEQSRLAVDDDLGDPARARGDDRSPAGHRLEVDDPERLVDRGADEDRGVREELDHLRLLEHALRARRSPPRSDWTRATFAPISSASDAVSGAPAASTICASGSNASAASSRCEIPFCRVIRPTKTTERPARVDAGTLEEVRSRIEPVLLRVDPVQDHVDPPGVERRVRGEHVVPHRRRDGDDRVGRLERRLLAEAREPVAAAELLGLPRAHRLERVDRRDVRDAVQQLRDVAAEIRVPGVRVDDRRAAEVGRHLQVDRHRLQRRRSRRRARRADGTRAHPGGLRRSSAPRRRRCAPSSRARYSTWTPAPP